MRNEIERLVLHGRDLKELQDLAAQLGEPKFRGRQLYSWLYRKRTLDFEEMTDLAQAFRKLLTDSAQIASVSIKKEQTGSDGSRKMLFELLDGNRIEGVLIPDGTRMTACLSSQVGCVIGCKFCATGKIGFIRNLTAAEIAGQFVLMDRAVDNQISNVVMMGMGEPLLNWTQVSKAAGLITDPDGLAVSRRRFAVSTVGWVPGIKRMIESGSRYKLTVSLNGTTDEQRQNMTPLSERFNIAEILEATREYVKISKQRATFTYLLLAGINDSLEDANRLIGLIRNISCKINLMEYNEIDDEIHRSGKQRTERFQNKLRSAGLTVTLRNSRGEDITAACGQLAGEYHLGDGCIFHRKS